MTWQYRGQGQPIFTGKFHDKFYLSHCVYFSCYSLQTYESAVHILPIMRQASSSPTPRKDQRRDSNDTYISILNLVILRQK